MAEKSDGFQIHMVMAGTLKTAAIVDCRANGEVAGRWRRFPAVPFPLKTTRANAGTLTIPVFGLPSSVKRLAAAAAAPRAAERQ